MNVVLNGKEGPTGNGGLESAATFIRNFRWEGGRRIVILRQLELVQERGKVPFEFVVTPFALALHRMLKDP
jgi:hypothetical protein